MKAAEASNAPDPIDIKAEELFADPGTDHDTFVAEMTGPSGPLAGRSPFNNLPQRLSGLFNFISEIDPGKTSARERVLNEVYVHRGQIRDFTNMGMADQLGDVIADANAKINAALPELAKSEHVIDVEYLSSLGIEHSGPDYDKNKDTIEKWTERYRQLDEAGLGEVFQAANGDDTGLGVANVRTLYNESNKPDGEKDEPINDFVFECAKCLVTKHSVKFSDLWQ